MNEKNIHCAIYQSPIGNIAIQGNKDTIESILFEQDVQETDYKGTSVEQGYRQLSEYFDKKRQTFDLPLVFNGTEFQNKVWSTLATIPYAKTISYLDLSVKLGNRLAIRAVGTANGSNQHTIVLPCHRVIGSDGSLTGYAGGLWRKKWLLEFESGQKQLELF